MTDTTAAIAFVCEVASVKTLADGGIRVAFDLPESASMQAAQLIECHRAGAALSVLLSLASGQNKTDERTEKSTAVMVGG